MPTPILMPALSPTMESGTLAKWLKKEGEAVAPGDVIAEIETDKATMEVEAVDEGRLGKILVAAGTADVAVNAPIAVLLAEGETASDLAGFDASAGGGAGSGGQTGGSAAAPASTDGASGASQASAAKASGSDEAAKEPSTAPASAKAPSAPAGKRVVASDRDGGGSVFPLGVPISPLARRIARQNGMEANDLKSLSGSGPHGRIVKRDIEAALAAGGAPDRQAAQAGAAGGPTLAGAGMDVRKVYSEGSYEEFPADGMRKTIARRLTQSFANVPHFPLTVDCEIDNLLRLRAELNAKSPLGESGYKISVNDFVLKASALALVKVPDANASWAGDAILKHRHADIGVAVAIDGGLITPIIWKAESKGLATIAAEVKDLAERARTRKLQPQEYQGGTFSVSNLGMFGITSFSSIINEPQGAILSVGAGTERAVVHDGALAVATVMTVTLSCDHRVVDGAVGARFLQAFKGLIEDPVRMLL